MKTELKTQETALSSMMSIESKEKSNDSYHCHQISIDGKDAKNLGDLVGQVLSHFLVFHFLRPQGPPDIICRWPTEDHPPPTEDHLPAQTTHQHLRVSTSSPISTAGPQKQQKKLITTAHPPIQPITKQPSP